MLYSIKNIEDLEKLEELASLHNQVKAVRLHDTLGEQNYYQNSENIFEPMTNAMRNASEYLTKTISETSIKNHQAISDLNE